MTEYTKTDGDELQRRVHTLRNAEALITGDRQADYGPPSVNHARIAAYWNQYLADNPLPLAPSDVAMMMVFVKIAREAQAHKCDSTDDACGYVALYEEMRHAEQAGS